MIKKVIKKGINKIRKIFIPRSEFLDEDPQSLKISGVKKEKPSYVGVVAPKILSNDSWFGNTPELSEKQLEYQHVFHMEKVMEEEKRKSESKESINIHEIMYEKATKNVATTLALNPIGGSENFQGGSENFHER